MPFVDDEDEIMKVVGQDRGELNMIFLFALVSVDDGPVFRMDIGDWKPSAIKKIMTKHQTLMQLSRDAAAQIAALPG